MLLPTLFGSGGDDLATSGGDAPRYDTAESAPESGAAEDGEPVPDAREVGDRVRLLLLASETDVDLFAESAGGGETGENPDTEAAPSYGAGDEDRGDRTPGAGESGREERFEEEGALPGLPEEAEKSLIDSDLTDEVPDCVRSAIGRGDAPLVAEENYDYGGTRTYLVVLPHGGNARLVDVFVVDASCVTGATAAEREDVLLEASFIRE
ncbi:hypothetical protein FNX48_021120 [Streptomyces sp. IF17]|nr:hypothetical protein [Streptomyces alkaliphilus]